ncbi:MAG: flagellar biosynthesis protein FliQ [Oscillospiraceae bacterium]|nr:flagellar biosynthesis protein FliQ [Oscillospiraceae bacterium]
MTSAQVMGVFQEAMMTAIKLSAPMLIVSIVVGLIVAIFQAATQIHEQTLTFVPKVAAIAALLLMTGSWMITLMVDFFQRIFSLMASL